MIPPGIHPTFDWLSFDWSCVRNGQEKSAFFWGMNETSHLKNDGILISWGPKINPVPDLGWWVTIPYEIWKSWEWVDPGTDRHHDSRMFQRLDGTRLIQHFCVKSPSFSYAKNNRKSWIRSNSKKDSTNHEVWYAMIWYDSLLGEQGHKTNPNTNNREPLAAKICQEKILHELCFKIMNTSWFKPWPFYPQRLEVTNNHWFRVTFSLTGPQKRIDRRFVLFDSPKMGPISWPQLPTQQSTATNLPKELIALSSIAQTNQIER